MLREIEQEYPAGTVWCSIDKDPNTKYNLNPIRVAVPSGMYHYGSSAKYSSGGFATMGPDMIFLEDVPMREVTDFSQVWPGNIMFNLDLGTLLREPMEITETRLFSVGILMTHSRIWMKWLSILVT